MTFGVVANMDPWTDAPDGEMGIGTDVDQRAKKANKSSRHRRERKKKKTSSDDDNNLLSTEESEHMRDSYKRKGDYSFRSGDYERAVSRYTRALELDPKNHVLLSNRSAAHLAQGRPEMALEDARACVEACPSDCRGYSRLAVALQRLELWTPAIDAYKRVLEIDPENQIAQRGIEICEMNTKEEQERNSEASCEQEESGDSDEDSNDSLHDQFFGRTSSHQRRRGSSSSDLKDHLEYHRENCTPAFPDGDANHAHGGDFASGSSGPSGSASNSSMSLLSKQLRVMQGKIQSQEDQIDRLNRQLQLVTDLKGTSPAELQSTLEEACNDEAHAELVGQIASLRTQLNAMRILGSSSASTQSGLYSSNNFERESYESTIASLELRVGELEEVEETLRKELAKLYRSLSDETCKASQLSSTCEFQKDQLVELMKNVTLVQKTERGKWSVVSKTGSTNTDQTVATSADSEGSVGTTNTNDSKSISDRLRNSELQLKMERDRTKLLEIQIEAREMESQLQKKQYKSRVQFQEERIVDLEHQLSMMHGSSNSSAMHVSEHGRSRFSKVSFAGEGKAVDEKYDVKALSKSSMVGVRTSRNSAEPEKIASGYLLKRDQGIIKGWKKRYFCLYQSSGAFHMTYSDAPNQKIKGTIGSITRGFSTVTQTTEFPKHPFAFVLRVNPKDEEAAVLYAATANQDDLRKWLMALRTATKGARGCQLQNLKPKVPPVAAPKSKEEEEEAKRRQRLERLLQKYGGN